MYALSFVACSSDPEVLPALGAVAGRDADAGPIAVDKDVEPLDAPLSTLGVSENKRYVVDGAGKPFLIVGDSPQSLLVNVSLADAEAYFAKRQAQGFNTLWINLLCDTVTSGRADGRTLDGIAPFEVTLADGKYDVRAPNPVYFDRASELLQRAAKHGFSVLLDPIETDGWLVTLRSNGLASAEAYGRYLGERFENHDNIVWMSGNNFQSWRTPEDDALVLAVARGIAATDTRHLQTVLLDYPGSSSSDNANWVSSGLLDIDAVFSYAPTFTRTLASYQRTPTRPVFLAESSFEDELVDVPALLSLRIVRSMAYWANLSGATGHLYGHYKQWKFGEGWKQLLDSPGATHVTHLKSLFAGLPWHELVPDARAEVLVAGAGSDCQNVLTKDCDRAVAARTASGSAVVVYMPTARELTIDLSKLSGPARARWFDPSAGVFSDVAGSPFANSGMQRFTPPAMHADGTADWVLVLQAG